MRSSSGCSSSRDWQYNGTVAAVLGPIPQPHLELELSLFVVVVAFFGAIVLNSIFYNTVISAASSLLCQF